MTTNEFIALNSTPDNPLGDAGRSNFGGRPGLLRRFLRDRFAVSALAFLVLLLAVAILAPLLAPHDWSELDTSHSFEGPSSSHWLGTDHIGRDTLSRILYGARYVLRDAFQVVVVTLLVGVPIGLMAGFKGGLLDLLTMRVMDAIHSIPTLILALALAVAANQNLNWALLGLSIGFLPSLVRLTRAGTLVVREETYIEASLALGTPVRRTLRKRVLPNVAAPIIIQTSIYMGAAIFLEAALSILGVGYAVGIPAWGGMVSEAFEYVHLSFWGMFFPGMAITFTILAFNLVGDGLRDSVGLDSGSLYGSRARLGLTRAFEH